MKRIAGLLMLLVAFFLVSTLVVAEGAYPSNGLALETHNFYGTKIWIQEEVTGLQPGEMLAAEAVESKTAWDSIVRLKAEEWADGGHEPGPSLYIDRLVTNYIRSPTGIGL